MDFIEKIFGVAPDGGDGSFELLLLILPIVGLALLSGVALRRRYGGARARGTGGAKSLARHDPHDPARPRPDE